MSNEYPRHIGLAPNNASSPAFFAPSQTLGTPSWHQPSPVPSGTSQNGSAVPPHPASQTNGAFSNQGSIMAMVAMMQHMQQNASEQYQQPPYTAQTQMAAEVQPPSLPQASDDTTLAQVIFEQTARGFTHKVALESLHGHNGIAAFAWKDYYLENKPRIDAIIVAIRARNLPSLSSNPERESPVPELNGDVHVRKKARQSETPTGSVSSDVNQKRKGQPTASKSKAKRRVLKTQKETPPVEAERASSGSRRRTLNSLASTPGVGFLATVPTGVPIDANTGLPAAPSRSPSPPAIDVNNTDTRGARRFTEADARFFFKRIAYDLARDPELTKTDLCDLLAAKAPNHTALSWRTYWSRHEDVADKMVLLTELDDEDREEVIRSWKTGSSVTASEHMKAQKSKWPKYAESLESGSSESVSDESDESDWRDGDIGSTEDDEELGEAGSSFTIAEIRVLAKYIATKPDWLEKGTKNWNDFFPMYPQRSPASWREFYRRKTKEINKLARKYMKKEEERQRIVSSQRGRPSWARKGNIPEGKQKSNGIERREIP